MLAYIKSHLNFYRIHLLSFILIPLLFAVIFWACNGEFKIKFIDALFVCISGVTGTGLTTVDLSSLTVWQQTIIVILELIGNQAFVAWVVVFVRRLYFLHRLEHIVNAELERKPTRHSIQESPPSVIQKERPSSCRGDAHNTDIQRRTSESLTPPEKFHPNVIRRMDIPPHLITPTGVRSMRSSPTIEDDSRIGPHSHVLHASGIDQLSRVTSRKSSLKRLPPPNDISDENFGGFPGAYDLVSRLFHRMFPRLHKNLQHTMTLPRTETLIPHRIDQPIDLATAQDAKRVPYISFRAIVGRNSAFHGLTSENIEELGGVEYRALTSLLWIVPLYYFGLLAISFVVVALYMNQSRWQSSFLPPQQHKKINPIWYSAFQVVGAWANTGMSLVDQNMVPFRTAYPMIVFLVFCVLAGNTLFPVFFRFTIWLLAKVFPSDSRVKESMHFLLDHPRRCFIYLFPSHQTWLLFAITMLLNAIDFLFDLVLDIGNPATEHIPIGTRIFDAVLQAAAVRSSGYQSIPISSLVPAVQVLYVIMMYIAIYPIAMSVRSTNVYEEKSLGIYEEKDDDVDDEILLTTSSTESRVAIWGKYLMRHARRQLAFDMWWLALSLFLICVIERSGIINPANVTWFNIFAILFEIVSAYGTAGLSLGIPTENFALSGAFHTLSKLIMCAVMLRGRHRGLPVALDRAVLLPQEFRLRSQGDVPQIPEDTPSAAEQPESSSSSSQEETSTLPESTGVRPRTRALSFSGDQTIQSPRTGDMSAYVMKEEPGEYTSGSGSAV